MQLRGTARLTLLLTCFLTCQATPLQNSPAVDGKIVRVPFRKGPLDTVAASQRRDLPASLKNGKSSGYLVDLRIGSPPQPVTLYLDTGSSEIWTFSSSACHNCQGGTFDPTVSRTGVAVNDIGNLDQPYADGSSVTGHYVKDIVGLGKAGIADVYLGVATTSNKLDGRYAVMGIGFSTAKHPGFLENLVRQKIIASNSYSIYLDNLTASTGSIVFGGIDNSKYSGKLVFLPIIQYAFGDNYPRLQVEWTYLSLTNSSRATTRLSATDLSYPANLDTGATLTALPSSIFDQLKSYFRVTGPDNNGWYKVDCQMPSGNLTFGFGKGPLVTIQVPFSELAIPLGQGKCGFGLTPQVGPQLAFGDTFLRSAYVNFDFGQMKIGLAQSVWT